MIKLTPLSFGLASSIIVGIFTYPSTAQAQFSPVQNAQQSVTINGNNNTVNQELTQTIIFQPGRGFGQLRNPPFSRSKYKKPKFKKSKSRYKQWKKGYKQWKKGYGHDHFKRRKKGRHHGHDDDD